MLKKFRRVRVKYQPAWPIFEVIPKPIYRDENGIEYELDIYYPAENLSEEQQLEMILRLEKILPEEMELKVEKDYGNIIILKDKKGNRYKFERLPR